MAISQETILEIRKKTNIVDVIAEYIPIEQRGKNYFAICPFHDDHNPSMSISPEKQIYTCFVCGAQGNVFTFVMEYEHISFLEAVKILGNKVGIAVDIGNYVKENVISDKEANLYDIYDVANKFYQNNLNTKDGKEAKDYLNDRGIGDDLIKEFGIGLSTSNKLYALLNSKKFSDDSLIKSGISSISDNRIYDTFMNRIMFPLYNLDGKVVGFSGRVYNVKDPSKYINSKESDIFKKGKLLYNYHRAKDEIRRKKYVIITEGFMDVIALYKVGIKNVVATMGTAVSSEQASLIKHLSSNVVLCFDGDNAGDKATLSCSLELIKNDIIPHVVRLKEGLDPDDFIKKYGVEEITNLLENPKTYLNYKIDYYKKNTDFNNSEQVSMYIKNVIGDLKNEHDNIVREITIKSLSDETNISVTTLNNLLKQETNLIVESKPIEKQITMLNKFEKAERRLLFYMLRHEEVIKIFEHNRCYLLTQDFRYLSNEILHFYKKYDSINIADFIAYLNDKKELIDSLSAINIMDINENYTYDEIMDYINLLNSYGVELEIKRLTNLFKSEIDEDKRAKIAKEISDLKVRV